MPVRDQGPAGPSQFGPASAGGFHPSAVAQSYRKLNPGMFDEFSDKELIDAIERNDPETYKLIDPMLLGAEVLQFTPPPRRMPIQTARPRPSGVVNTAIRVAPAVIGGLAGSTIGPEGTVAGGMAGAGTGEFLAQGYEQLLGERDAYSLPSILVNTGLGGVAPGTGSATTVLGRTGMQALYGGGLGTAGTALNTYINEGRMATPRELLEGGATGAVTGGVLHLGLGEAPRYVNEGLRGLRGADLTGALPIEPGPPPSLEAGDMNPAALAAKAQYQAEEQYLAGKLKAVFGADMVRANKGSLHNLTQARQYLDELAKLKEGGNYPPVELPQPATPEEVGMFGQPMGVEPQLALPPAGGAGSDAGLGPPPFRVYPAGGAPPALEEVAASPRVIVPSEGVYGQPPAASTFDAMELSPIPGDRSTFNRDVTGRDFLTAEPVEGPPPARNVSHGTPMFGPPPLRNPNERIEQSGRMGGRAPSREQPRLEGVERPSPLAERPYTEGPNAGPRRAGELHGEPRILRRNLATVDEQGRPVTKQEQYKAEIPAEDPATYPAEVRRELATMVYELDQYRYEKHQGGTTEAQRALLAEGETGNVGAAATKKSRETKIAAGGATAGAPVFHEVAMELGKARPSLGRAQLLQRIRAALLEGRGSIESDAAAQVARRRLAARAAAKEGGHAQAGAFKGYTQEEADAARELGRKPTRARILAQRGDEGDDLINWMDEATGSQAMPSHAVDEFTQAAREADSSDILAAKRVWDAGEMRDNPWFKAAVEEGTRRGYWEPTQEDLRMEGPGGAGGPKLTDFEGGPPPKPGDVQGAGPADVALPGLENVRSTENAHPDVAEVPFALTPPPDRVSATQARMTARRQQGSLFDRLKGEEGVLIFDVPAGDRAGLKKWLKANQKDHEHEPWFNRVEQAIEDGEWDRAFKLAAGASARAYARAYDAASTPQEIEALRRAVKGTPLQSDINTEIVASARARAGVGTAPPVKDFPPSLRVTQAGAARGRATLGPAGILHPGPPQRPLSTIGPSLRAGTLDKAVIQGIIEDVADPTLMALVPGNEDSLLRVFRQIGEQLYDMPANSLKAMGYGNITPQELSQHFEQTVSDSARLMGALGRFVQANSETLHEAAEGMSMGGALRGMLGGSKSGPPRPSWVRGKGALSPAGAQATEELIAAIKAGNKHYDEAQLRASLQKPNAVTMAEALFDASYSFRLAQWATAARNYTTAVGRYSVETLDHALSAGFATALGDVETAKVSAAQARERGLSMVGRRGSYVSPRRAWSDDVATMFDMTTESLSNMKPRDVRNTLKALIDMPAEAVHFLGTMDERSGGGVLGKYEGQPKWIQAINSPKVRNFLTTFNRMQEFSARSVIFDSSVRAQVRAQTGLSSLETAQLLQRSTPDIIAAVGGQQNWQSIIQASIRSSLEGTFAGALAKNSIPAAMVRLINTVWPAKLAIPFPAFNLARAPRFIWDHNFAGGLLELGRYQMDKRGWTTMRGKVSGGRLYRGVRSQTIKEVELPATQRRLADAHQRRGEIMMELPGVQRELAVRNRMVKRLEPKAQAQGALPETVSAYEQALQTRDQLAARRETLRSDFRAQRDIIRDLNAEVKGHLEHIADTENINAPNFSQFLARQTVGAGMLGAAVVLRNSLLAEGTQWYQLKTGQQTAEGDEEVLDLRPYGGFVQHLYVADVVNDLLRHTDLAQASKDMSDEGRSTMNPFEWGDALWNNYKGKYSNDELSSQFAQAFLSISRASGTTLTLAELATQDGWPNATEFGKAVLGTIGQYLASYTVPLQMLDATPGLTSVVPQEAELRRVPKWTPEKWYRGLMAPVENTPGLKLTQPPRLNQFTGRTIRTEHPTFKGLTGIGTQGLDRVTAEARKVGMPLKSLMLPETGDSELDQLAQQYYAEMVGPALQDFFQGEEYQQAGSPADKRDVWQAHGPQSKLRRVAWDRAREALGPERVKAARTTGEAARRELRTQRRLQSATQETGGGPPSNPLSAPGAEEESSFGPPPGPAEANTP